MPRPQVTRANPDPNGEGLIHSVCMVNCNFEYQYDCIPKSERRRSDLNIFTAFNRESYLIKPRMKCFVVDTTQLLFRIQNSYLEILNTKFR